MRPLEKTKFDHAVWYSSTPSTPIGRNQLARMVPEMCMLGNISGHKTNHSLRATGATMLYEAEVPEKIIQERTGGIDHWKAFEPMNARAKNNTKLSPIFSPHLPSPLQQLPGEYQHQPGSSSFN